MVAVGTLQSHDFDLTTTRYTRPRRLLEKLTSEFNCPLAVHQEQVSRRGVDFQTVVTHAEIKSLADEFENDSPSG